MRRLWFILFLLPVLGFSQAFQRQFWTTNTHPWVLISPGTNCFVTYHLLGSQTNQFVIDIPASGSGQTNVTILSQGTNVFVHSTTNSGVITYTVDVPTQPQQTNWSLADITNLTTLQIAWQQITNVDSIQIPLASITNLASLQIPGNSVTSIVATATTATYVTGNNATLTNHIYATNVESGGQLPIGTVATNTPNVGDFLSFTGSRDWTKDGSTLTNINNLSPGLTNYILNLVAGVNRNFYFASATNTLGVGTSTNCSTMIDTPVAAAATNSIAVPNPGVYFLSRVSTNTVTRIEAGPIALETYIFVTGGGGVQTITAHPEIWIWFTNNTMVQLASAGSQVFIEGTGEPIIFNTTMNVSAATNLTGGAHILLRWFADAVANSPTWNFVIGGVYDSHISVNIANQSGTYIGSFIGDGSGITNAPYIANNNGTGTNTTLFNSAAPALTLHGGFLSTNDITGSMALQTNGTLQISNASVVAAIGLGNTNVLEVDTVPLKSALAVDTNGTVFVKSLTASRIAMSDARDGLSSVAASGAVPINADGSATTSAQVNTLYTGGIIGPRFTGSTTPPGSAWTVSTANRFVSVVGTSFASSSDEGGVAVAFPIPCTLTNFYMRAEGIGTGTNAVATVMTNGVASSITLNWNGQGSTLVQTSDTAHGVSIPAGCTVSVKITDNVVSSGTITLGTLSLEYY